MRLSVKYHRPGTVCELTKDRARSKKACMPPPRHTVLKSYFYFEGFFHWSSVESTGMKSRTAQKFSTVLYYCTLYRTRVLETALLYKYYCTTVYSTLLREQKVSLRSTAVVTPALPVPYDQSRVRSPVDFSFVCTFNRMFTLPFLWVRIFVSPSAS